MPAFTIMCLFAIAVTLLVDHIAGTKLYRSKRFWVFQFITAGLTIAFDLFAHNKVWTINEASTLGANILGTPVELLAFGFVLLYANVIAFELIQRAKQIGPPN